MQKRSSVFTVTTLLFGGLLATIAGCSSAPGANSIGPALPLSEKVPNGGDLFVSNFYASEIVIYAANAENPEPSGTISDGVSYPYNLAVDQAGTLYVQNNNNTITEYPEGASEPAKTLTEPKAGIGTGICVTVGTDSTVYAADHYVGQVYEFKNGSGSSSTTLDVSEAFGLALDSHNNLYVGWADGSSGASGHVMKFKPGATSGKDLGITVKSQGGLAIDSHDDLLLGDQGNQVIDIFKKGATTPFRTIDTSPYYPYQFAFDRKERYLYLVSGTPAAVYVYEYKTGKLAWTDSEGLKGSGYAEGVALRPAAKP
ncbi:MAG: hypothetical protein ABSD52_11015 [Candidatus Cybelea sp.]|jgi:hypothetical protein